MEPNYWVLFALCFAGAGGLVFLFWLNHKIRTWGQPKSEAPESPAPSFRRPQTRRSPIISRSSPTLTEVLLARLLGTERTNASSSVQERSPHQDARSSVQEGARVQGVQGEILPNSREELQQLIAATEHKRNGKTKQESIERAFGIKKGGSPTWKRASDLFDAATEPTSRYRQYSEGELAVLRRQPIEDL